MMRTELTPTTKKIATLPARPDFTVGEALGQVLNEHRAEPYTDILIIAYDKDGDIIIRSSEMNRAEANFMIDKAKDFSLGTSYEEEMHDHAD